MYSVIRNYTGTPGLADDLNKNSKAIENEISSVPGFVAYYLLKTSEGACSITVCDERRGCEDSTTRAANWLTKNMPNLKAKTPTVISGEVSFKFANYKTVKA